MEKKRNTTEFCFRISFIFLLSVCTMIFSSSSASAITCLDTSSPTNADFQELIKEESVQGMVSEGKTKVSRRLLQGRAGSSMPQCISMCNECTPCEPVQVTTQSETSTEYFPEAWRCKCGDKLYMPAG